MEILKKGLHPKLPKFVLTIREYLSQKKFPAQIVFIIVGLLSTIWFLIRVIPKPDRAAYPCMRAAYPFMSGFLCYLLGIAATLFAFKNSRKHFVNSRYFSSALFLLLAIVSVIFFFTKDSIPVYANSKLLIGPNQPVGQAKGIFPGRVVWVWDSSATNENIPLNDEGDQVFGEGWFLPKHTNMNAVVKMAADAILKLTEEETLSESWDELFRYFNQNHGKGDVGYTDGEKIFIKTNQVSASGGTYNESTFEIKDQGRYGMAETSPQVVLAVLRQLVNEYGIKEENISVGDPMKHMYKHVFDMWRNEFPNIVCIDKDARLGRTVPVSDGIPDIYYSDRGNILDESSDEFPNVISEADYLINIPALKAHARGGVTLTAKNHFGSNLKSGASHLHKGLVAPDKMSNTSTLRLGYGLYRVQVDLMGCEHLGDKTVLFLVDGLWGGSEANDPPRKFSMTPFNNDWTSSIFISQDQVAIESVCFDFLKTEYTEDNPYGSYPQMEGADDYILQAADSAYWPADIKYDPENDGLVISSLGVCEHWNNPVDKQYSRNLNTGDGIELLFIDRSITSVENYEEDIPLFILFQNYPNPFNPATTISFVVPHEGKAILKIYDLTGREVVELFNQRIDAGRYYQITFDASDFSSGVYLCRLDVGNQHMTKKLMLMK
jgi:hypothetical protein